MQGNAAMYSNANVWMQTFHCCCTGMLRQLPTDLSAQQSLLSSLYRQLPSEAQQACEGAEQGITLDELQAAVKLSARGKKPGSDGLPYEFVLLPVLGGAGPRAAGSPARCLSSSAWPLLANLHDSRRHHLAVQGQGLQGPVGQIPPHYPPQQRLRAAGQGSGYPIWACPSACGGPHSKPLLCLVAGLAITCCAM